MINRIKQKVQTFLNTDNRGNFSPEEYNLLLHNAIQDRFEELLYEVNRQGNRENVGRMGNSIENIPERLREKINHYLKQSAISAISDPPEGPYNFPADYKYFDALYSDTLKDVEFAKNRKEFNILKRQAMPDFPLMLITNNQLHVYPDFNEDDFEEGVHISYIRKPKYPKWTYEVVSGVELFNSSGAGFQDADVHPSEEAEMVRRILMSFGINLKEQDIQNVVLQKNNAEFNQQNAG